MSRAAELEEDVSRLSHHRRLAAQGALGLFQVGRRVGSTARLADVAVLVGGAAARASAFDEAVGEKALVGLAPVAVDLPVLDLSRGAEPLVYLLNDESVGLGVRH